MSEMVHITINKQPLEVPAGTRIMDLGERSFDGYHPLSTMVRVD